MSATLVQTTTVVRPFKWIAVIAGFIAIILLIVSIAGINWIEGQENDTILLQGLWKRCKTKADVEDCTEESVLKAYHKVTAALSIISLLICITVTIVATVTLISGWDGQKKRKLYFISGIGMVTALILELMGLVVFIPSAKAELPLDAAIDKWWYGWAFGVAWGSIILILGSAVLLLIKQESREVSHEKKVYYTNESVA